MIMLKDFFGSLFVCYDESMTHSRTQGSATVVVIAILVVAIIGALGYVFWRTQLTRDNFSSVVVQESAGNNRINNYEQTERYLVLEDWRVKFKISSDIDEVRYYKKTDPNPDVNEYYELSTKRVENLGERCVEPNMDGYATRLASIERSKVKIEGPHPSTAYVNNNEPINGYYYYVSRPQSLCASGNVEMQMSDTNLLHELLQKPITY